MAQYAHLQMTSLLSSFSLSTSSLLITKRIRIALALILVLTVNASPSTLQRKSFLFSCAFSCPKEKVTSSSFSTITSRNNPKLFRIPSKHHGFTRESPLRNRRSCLHGNFFEDMFKDFFSDDDDDNDDNDRDGDGGGDNDNDMTSKNKSNDKIIRIIPNGINSVLDSRFQNNLNNNNNNGKESKKNGTEKKNGVKENKKPLENLNEKGLRELNDIECKNKADDLNDLDCDPYGLEAFQDELSRRQPKPILQEELEEDDDVEKQEQTQENEEEPEFTGYDMRDAIYNKFGKCFDMDFRPVTSLGQTSLYLNVMPFFLGSKRFRHASEYDYLCHLQAIVDILIKYNKLEYVMKQMEETDKKPRPGTSPLIAVPFRLDLEERDMKDILGY